MTHGEIIGKYALCKEFAEKYNLKIEVRMEYLTVYDDKDNFLIRDSDINCVYSFLMGYSYKHY